MHIKSNIQWQLFFCFWNQFNWIFSFHTISRKKEIKPKCLENYAKTIDIHKILHGWKGGQAHTVKNSPWEPWGSCWVHWEPDHWWADLVTYREWDSAQTSSWGPHGAWRDNLWAKIGNTVGESNMHYWEHYSFDLEKLPLMGCFLRFYDNLWIYQLL